MVLILSPILKKTSSVPLYIIYKVVECFATTIPVMEHHTMAAVCQMTSTACKKQNIATCVELVRSAKNLGAVVSAKCNLSTFRCRDSDTGQFSIEQNSLLTLLNQMAFFPEACDYIAPSAKETVELAEPLAGPFVTEFRKIARDNSMWISLGGVHETIQGTPDKIYMCHVIINSDGHIVGTYRKSHTFDARLSQLQLCESSYVQKGNTFATPLETIVGKLGAAICYDLRFPEVGISLTEMGAQLLAYPSAFTYETGSQHWEILLRSRAIENQCYVIAAAQTGHHGENRRSWGHSMIVDPSGRICAECTDGVTVAIAEIDLNLIKQAADRIPVWSHKRYDLYPKLTQVKCIEGTKRDAYQFGPVSIDMEMVFYESSLSVAFVNKRCVVPGHVLVIPIRAVKRLSELNCSEIADMFLTVQKVQTVMESVHNTTSTTIAIQDGPDAGQTIWHLHAHILPRKAGDFADNDDVYRMLEKHDKKQDAGWRTEDEMKSEAKFLRERFMYS